jgi:hypothetical protein
MKAGWGEDEFPVPSRKEICHGPLKRPFINGLMCKNV